jgi:2-polyprenyl-3-methyl-5-hydroxy-6-metoxy-1,4-benzoquinol methylase
MIEETVSLQKGYIPANLSSAHLQEVQNAVNRLYSKLKLMDLNSFDLKPYSKIYFNKCHIHRLHFSLECSAYNLLWAIAQFPNKNINELTILDYGAGLGTQYLLAKECNFKKVYYNDYNLEWCVEAQNFCRHLKLDLDAYIPGDIKEVSAQFSLENKTVDIIISRNVIEHLPDLNHYYFIARTLNPGKVVMIDSTSANTQNPLVLLNHIRKHRIVEKKIYQPSRQRLIKNWAPQLAEKEISLLVNATREYWGENLKKVVLNYVERKEITVKQLFYSNTCDPENGIWYERILKPKEYQTITQNAGWNSFQIPGFWDTHYKNPIINWISFFCNKIIRTFKLKSVAWAPFMAIVSIKEQSK